MFLSKLECFLACFLKETKIKLKIKRVNRLEQLSRETLIT